MMTASMMWNIFRPQTVGNEILFHKRVVLYLASCELSRRGAVVKGVEHISTNLFVNIWVARVRVPLVLSVGIWIRKNSTINT